MAFSVVIPARYASTRLPGKPLLEIGGKPMIQHVYERASESQAAEVVIATDDERIYEAAESFGAKVVMTAATHNSGTDRLEEVASRLGYADDHIVVNVQGDEPLIPAALINQVADNLATESEASIATLCERIHDRESVFNPNVVKVVFDHKGMAHYFSRAAIPWARDDFAKGPPETLPGQVCWYRHIGIYAYRVSLLKAFVEWEPAPLEVTEALEQLRALWNDARIHVAEAGVTPAPGVDTAADLERVRAILETRQ